MNIGLLNISAVSVLALSLGACTTADVTTVRNHPKEAPIVFSSPVRSNVTPLNKALSCFGDRLKAKRGNRPLGIAIGDVKDYTGKQGQDEGFAITQGGALMAYSALGKIGSGVRVHERFDTRIAEAELVYMNQRQLGDGSYHSIDDPNNAGEKASVPWKPYFGGSIRQSEYFIVGGITELNYNIQSGGAEVAVNQVGPKGRIYTMNVAVDLRIVGTQSLMVYDTVSIEKQVTGYEVGAGVFRFFGTNLFDINVGAKNQEPLQLGVRMAIEAGVMQLVGSIARVDPRPCMPPEYGPVEWDGANAAAVEADLKTGSTTVELPPPAKPGSAVASYASQPAGSAPATAAAARFEGLAPTEALDAGAILDLGPTTAAERARPADGGEFAIVFSGSGQELDPMSQATIKQAADLVRNGRRVNLTISGGSRDSLSQEERATLGEERIRTVVAALLRHGISKAQASLLWQAAPDKMQLNQATLGDSGTDLHEIARVRVR
ncbi:hypothetical protein ATER59S_00975 [Aquamicrobium terrae]